MHDVVYDLSTSLDGYTVDADGGIDWSVPDDEVFRLAVDEVRRVGVHLLGRRLYETMVVWETASAEAGFSPEELEFARIWQELPKVVFSSTLTEVVGNTRIATDDLATEIARLKASRVTATSPSAARRWRRPRPTSGSSTSTASGPIPCSWAPACPTSPTTAHGRASSSSSAAGSAPSPTCATGSPASVGACPPMRCGAAQTRSAAPVSPTTGTVQAIPTTPSAGLSRTGPATCWSSAQAPAG
nr:dihydrofolate reductase family protein [Tessaracoccus defluvii]